MRLRKRKAGPETKKAYERQIKRARKKGFKRLSRRKKRRLSLRGNPSKKKLIPILVGLFGLVAAISAVAKERK